MSFTKTNLEILDIDKLVDFQTNYAKLEKSLLNNETKDKREEKEFILKINIIDAKTLVSSLGDDESIAPKFKYLYAYDDYHFGTTEHFINNCNFNNLNKITTLDNNWNNSWNDLHQFDIIVSSKEEDIEFIKTSMQKLDNGANRFYVNFSINDELKEEGILTQLQKHINPKIEKSFLVNMLECMGVCAKIDFIHRENKRFLAKTEDLFFEKVKMSLKNLDDNEKIDIEKYFQKTYNFKRNTSFIKWVTLSWIIKK